MTCEQAERVSGYIESDVELVGNVGHGDGHVAVHAPADVPAKLLERDEPARHLGVDSGFVARHHGTPHVGHARNVAAAASLVVHELVAERGAAVEAAESGVERDASPAGADVLDPASAGPQVRPFEVDVVAAAQVSPWVPSVSAAHLRDRTYGV